MSNIPKTMILEQMELGPMQNFLYYIGDAESKEIAVVDPAWDVDFLCDEADQKGFTIVSIFLTHGHSDHVNGLDAILKRHDVPAYISAKEAPFYKPQHKNIVEIKDGQKLKIGRIEFDCLHTPGHTPGGICFKHENVLITGDTLFIDGCGRCDLPGGNAKQMYKSLYETIKILPDETLLYTGHNYGPKPFDTLKGQKKTNSYLLCDNLENFLHQRMGISL